MSIIRTKIDTKWRTIRQSLELSEAETIDNISDFDFIELNEDDRQRLEHIRVAFVDQFGTSSDEDSDFEGFELGVGECCVTPEFSAWFKTKNEGYWLSLIGGVNWSKLTGSTDDDWIDRISHLWTVCLLLLFAVVVSSGQYVGDPIHCWCPAEFTGAYVAYTKHYCWISNTYYIPMGNSIPMDINKHQDQELAYYQWVPIILLFQALLFKLPNIVWHMLNTYSGINMTKICELTDATQFGKPDERDANVKLIAKYIDRWLKDNRHYHRNFVVRVRQKFSNIFCFCFGKREGHFLTGFYLFVKILYCINCVCQFFLLDAFLAMDYGGYGFEVLRHLGEMGNLKESPRFPRVTLCDFEIRQLSNLQRWTVQCVLPINLFNEKIFTALWFWLFFVAVLTFGNLASWLFYMLFRHNRQVFVRKYLYVAGEIQTGFDKKLSRQFADKYLRDDGMFLLRIVGKNSSQIVLTDLVQEMWKMFKDTPVGRKAIVANNDGGGGDKLPNGDEKEAFGKSFE